MFLEEIERVAKISKSIMKEKKVKILAQFDADGISSAALITKSLLRENVNFELRILKQLTSKKIDEMEVTEKDFLILLDFGSGQLPLLEKFLDKTQILILDHHEISSFNHLNLLHINPLLFGEDEMSSSIICYLFAKFLNQRNVDLVDMAIIGAVADEADEKWQFKGLAKKILEEAETIGKISVSKGLRFYGRYTRPIYKSLAYTFDPFIPGISGSESGAVQFLSDLGINLQKNGEWVKLKDLTLEEQQKLASAIIIQRITSDEVAEDIFGELYNLLGKPEELQDAREFATLLNACGRTDNSHIGIKLLLNNYFAIDESYSIMDNYRKILSNSLNWVRENKDSIVSTDQATFILGRDKIPETVIGTVTSIILNSKIGNSEKFVFGMVYAEDDKVKISARAPKKLDKVNMRDIILQSAKLVGGEGGGHLRAAGGLIPKGKEYEFINIADKLIGEMIAGKKN